MTVGDFSHRAAFSRNRIQDRSRGSEAHRIDKSHCREELSKHKRDTAAASQKKINDEAAALTAKGCFFASVRLVLTPDTLDRTRNADLDDQIRLYRRLKVGRRFHSNRLGTKVIRLALALRLSIRHATRS